MNCYETSGETGRPLETNHPEQSTQFEAPELQLALQALRAVRPVTAPGDFTMRSCPTDAHADGATVFAGDGEALVRIDMQHQMLTTQVSTEAPPTSTKLAKISFRLLTHLARTPNQTVGRTELSREVWGTGGASGACLRMAVNRLRGELGTGIGASVVATMIGRGYRLIQGELAADLTFGPSPRDEERHQVLVMLHTGHRVTSINGEISVTAGNRAVNLTHAEEIVLSTFIGSEQCRASLDDLSRALGRPANADTTILRIHLQHLRRKLGGINSIVRVPKTRKTYRLNIQNDSKSAQQSEE